MKNIVLAPGVEFLPQVDYARPLFDALIPLPEGTSYNAYLVRGAAKTALLDTAEPAFADALLERLADVPRLDYVIAHHAEPDHAGALPAVLARFPEAVVCCTEKARTMLTDRLPLDPARLRAVADGETLDLGGGRALRFIALPWVHWPETMGTWLEDVRILFSCDFFGAHLATTATFARDDARWEDAARLYYAQIMMPYAHMARKNLARVQALRPAFIAPSHGPVHDAPERALALHEDWLNGPARNRVALAHVSMHGGTERMARRLADALTGRGVAVTMHDLTRGRLDRLASSLLDAATFVLGAPAVWNGRHPLAVLAAALFNGLKPKTRWATAIGCYGWSDKALAEPAAAAPDFKGEWLPPVFARGRPTPETDAALDTLAQQIADRHRDAKCER